MQHPSGRRPGRQTPFRPFCYLVLLVLLFPEGAGAQFPDPWTMLARLAMPGPERSVAVAGAVPWLGQSLQGGLLVPAGGPIPLPGDLLGADLPLLTLTRGGTLGFRARDRQSIDPRSYAQVEEVTVAVPLGEGTGRLFWGGGVMDQRTRMPVEGDRGMVDAQARERPVWVGGRWKTGAWDLAAAAGLRDPDEASWGGSLGVEGPLGGGRITLWGRSAPVEGSVALRWEDARTELRAPARSEEAGVAWEGPLAGWHLDTRIEVWRGRGRGRVAEGHRYRPRPRGRMIRLALEPPGRGRFEAGTMWGTHRLDLESEGLRYGRFLVRDRRWWLRWSGEVPGPLPLALWAGSSWGVWKGEGTAEFWPFTPLVVDILGLRRYMQGDLPVTTMAAGFRWKDQGGRWRVRTGADLVHISAGGGLVSWEPLVLGLGRQNELHVGQPIRRVLLTDLGLEIALRMGDGIDLSGGGAQVIPLAVARRSREIGGTGGTGPGSRQGERGGTRWWLALRLSAPRPAGPPSG